MGPAKLGPYKDHMRKAQGFTSIKQFQHKAKVRTTMPFDQDQATRLSPWCALDLTDKVDIDRVNNKGLISVPLKSDHPRLVRH